MACHLRSVSLPSRPHSLETKVEEELQHLSTSISSSSSSIDTICDGFKRLGDAYDCIQEAMRLPSTQVGLSKPQQKKWVDEELERSLELLDLCSAMQENFSEMKMTIQDLQLVLRRASSAAIQRKLQDYVRFAKKAKNGMKKIGNKCRSPVVEDCSLAMVVKLLTQAREMAITLLQASPSLLSKQTVLPTASKWSLILKSFPQRNLAFEEEQLQDLALNIGGLEIGLELLFRQLIQSRVSLLNIFSC